MHISVVIPAYNEAERLGGVLRAMPKKIGTHTVGAIVVDDGSKDGTSTVAKEVEGVKVLHHQTNLGKGAAAKTGCDAACKMKADIIVLMDADGQHKPEDIERMIKPLLEVSPEKHTLVIGVRRRSKSMPLMMRLGNSVMNSLAYSFFKITTKDTQSGFRAFRAATYPKVRWNAAHYEMEMEMLIIAAARRVEIKEVGIATIYHDHYKGTTVLDGLRILRTLIKWRILWFREYRSLESFSL